jgi:uncharacterized membrane protein YdbT with pleckstrin-like domain
LADKLMPGEVLVRSAHRHWLLLVKELVFPVALLVLAVLIDVAVGGIGRDVKLVVTLGVLAVGGLWAIVVWWQWASASFTITDQRVLLLAGVINRTTKVIALDRVQDVSTRQSPLGRVFNYGVVEIDAAGASGAEVLDHVPDPNDFRDEVFAQAERRRGSAAQQAPVPQPT